MKKLIKSKLLIQVIVASLVATLATAGIVIASTTIGANINTGGTLDVSGASTLAGNTAVTGTLGVTGKTTLVNASTTLMSVSGQAWFNDNATVAAGKGLILGSSATALTGSAGMIYYDSGSSVIKMHDGTSWFTVGTSTSGISLSGSKLQLADLSYYATIGTTTAQGLSELTVEATSTAAIPLTLVARSSQAANLFQIRNSSSANLLYVNSAGGLFASSTLQATGATYLYGALTVDGLTTLGNASTTVLTVSRSTFLNTASSTGIVKFAQIQSTTGAISFDNENLTTTGTLAAATTTISLGDFTVGTTDFYVDDDNARVGIGSSSPFAQLSIGTVGSATSTIATNRFCMFVEDQEGKSYYISLNMAAANADGGIFATSTTPCNQ